MKQPYQKQSYQSKSYYPDIYITAHAKRKLDLYLQCASGEISGLGSVMRSGDDFLIYDIHLFSQACSPTATDLKTDDIHQMLYQAVVDGLDPSVLKLWWHSHVNMSCFWSKTDEDTALQLAKGGWFLSIVGVKRGEYLCRLDIDQPVPITLDELELKVYYPVDDSLRAEIEKEVRAKVTVMPEPKVLKPYVKGITQSNNDDDWKEGWVSGYGFLETT